MRHFFQTSKTQFVAWDTQINRTYQCWILFWQKIINVRIYTCCLEMPTRKNNYAQMIFFRLDYRNPANRHSASEDKGSFCYNVLCKWKNWTQRVTKRRLFWLTNSAHVYKPKWSGKVGAVWVSSNEYSCTHAAQINFGDLTLPYLISRWWRRRSEWWTWSCGGGGRRRDRRGRRGSSCSGCLPCRTGCWTHGTNNPLIYLSIFTVHIRLVF